MTGPPCNLSRRQPRDMTRVILMRALIRLPRVAVLSISRYQEMTPWPGRSVGITHNETERPFRSASVEC